MDLKSLLEVESTEKDNAIRSGSTSSDRDLDTILNVVRKINTSLVLTDVLELVVDEAIRITKADRGFLMLADKHDGLQFVVGRNLAGKTIEAKSFEVSSTVLEDVFRTGESLCIENALDDERYELRQSIVNLELQTIICSPLRTPKETIGVIYVDSKFIQPVDKADTLHLFEILAGQAAIAIKNASLYDNLKVAYEELKNANEQIVKSERMALKGEIAGQVSHELNNMVSIVLLQLEVLERMVERSSQAEIKQMLGNAKDAANKISGFAGSFLTRSRATAKLLPTNPQHLLEDFYRFIMVLPKFKRNDVKLRSVENVPDVAMDIDQIQQVLLNLVKNAVEAFPDAGISLEIAYDSMMNVVQISVSDNGPGIDEEIRERILKEKVTTKPDGHGYGLPICRQIIEHHGGKIRVESEKGHGTKFIMDFPAVKASSMHEAA